MFSSLRQRTSDEGGFTLIELLVVILIIGILAAIAIPSLLSQKSKAYSANAKTLASSSQTAAETYGTDNNETFTNLTAAEIHSYEKNIQVCASGAGPSAPPKEACLLSAGPISGNAGYTLTVVAAHTGTEFSVERTSEGGTVKTCKPATVTDGCPTGSSW